MKGTIYSRFFLLILIVLFLLMTSLYAVQSYLRFEGFLNKEQSRLQVWGEILATEPVSFFSGKYQSDQQTGLEITLQKLQIIPQLLEKKGDHFQQMGTAQPVSIEHLVNPSLIFQGFSQQTYQITTKPSGMTLYYGERYTLSTGNFGILFLTYQLDETFRVYKKEQRVDLLLFISVYLILILIFGLYIRRLAKPVRHLVTNAREVISGNVESRVYLEGNDEYRLLADSFNHITEQNEELIDELMREKEGLQAIITALKEALWLIDRDEVIVFSNATFRSWLGREDVEGHHYWEFIRDQQLDKLLQQVWYRKEAIQQEIPLLNRKLVLNAQYIPVSARVLVVLNDITDIQAAQEMKKDLISSVSHELKTPLTAIKGFVETLRADHPSEEQDRYLQIIERNANRLTRIVQDLLILAHLEDASQSLEKEKLDLKDLLERVVQIFQHRCEEKDLYLDLDVPDRLMLESDAFKLEQVFINLIDNAYKYTEKGGISITASRQKDHISVIISDTGIGIPQRQQGRIFERFYVVDKSRSRRQGGTGLGLSIVRHIITLLGGEIHLESAPEKGSTFTIILPFSF